ncbi:MAG: element excision factor XisH family protein [Pseudanabaena sp. ELA645]
MSARDLFHEAVKQALIKDGWTITNNLSMTDLNQFFVSLVVQKTF